jgi:hypothetical protein
MVRQPPNRSRDGRLRFRDRRQSVITLPPTAKCFVEQDELDRDSLLSDDALLLHLKLLALGVENIQDVRQATVIALERQIDGSTALREGGLQILQTLARSAKIGDRVVHLPDRYQNGFLVVHQKFVRFQFLGAIVSEFAPRILS